MGASRTWLWAGLLVAGVVVASTVPLEAAEGGHVVEIKAGAFTPREEVVGVGDVVVWEHADGTQAHSVTSDSAGSPDAKFTFDSHPECSATNTAACMQSGQTFRVAFTRLGEYPYYSRPHGAPGGQGVAGMIKVVPKGQGSSTSTRP